MIRDKMAAMERESLTMKEEKAALAEMKRIKDDHKKLVEWESSMEANRNKKAHQTESLRKVYEELDQYKNAVWYDEVSSKLGVAKADLSDVRLSISEGMSELLSSSSWKKKLQVA